MQQHRHEANRCLDALTEAQGEKRQMQKRMDELEAVVESANSRWASLQVCISKCSDLIFCLFFLFVVFGRAEASARQYRAIAEEKVQLQVTTVNPNPNPNSNRDPNSNSKPNPDPNPDLLANPTKK